MANRKKRGKDKNTKTEYLRNKMSFLDEIKSIFCNYLRAIRGYIKNKGQHPEDT